MNSALFFPHARVTHFAIALFLCCGSTWLAPPGRAQETSLTVGPSGLQRFSPGRWSTLVVSASNQGSEDVVETASVFLAEDPTVQFSTELWIPAKSRRRTWVPLLIPSSVRRSTRNVDLSSIRLIESEGEESFGNQLNDSPIQNRSLMMTTGEINTGLMMSTSNLSPTPEQDLVQDRIRFLVELGREKNVLSDLELPLVGFTSSFLPSVPGALDQLDQLVMAGDLLRDDTGGIQSVRQWLRSGGRLWIMLDRTDPDLVRSLLGDGISFSVIDRVQLNAFEMESQEPKEVGGGRKVERWESEQPVELVRILADQGTTAAKIDDWPAAIWIPFGQGRVLLTTLATRGWMTNGGEMSPETKLGVAINPLANEFFEPAARAPVYDEVMKPLLSEKIGYQIPDRSIAASVLGANALVILVGGLWWWHRRRLEKLAFLIPVSAIVTTGMMLMIGRQQTQSVPSKVASGQVAKIHRGGIRADVSALHAVYSQTSEPLDLTLSEGALVYPTESDVISQTRRVRWDDRGQAVWIAADQRPGSVEHLSTVSTTVLQSPIRLTGSFDETGFRGELQGLPDASPEDGLIVNYPSPMTAAELKPGGDQSGSETVSVVAKPDGLLRPGEFIRGNLISDTQRSRQIFLKQVFAERDGNPPASIGLDVTGGSIARGVLGQGPALLTWADPLDVGFQFSETFERDGLSLVSIPIELARPTPGQPFRVPASFVRTEVLAGERGFTSLFNLQTGKWLPELTASMTTDLVFQFPDRLAGLEVQSISITLKVSAPTRTMSLRTGSPGETFTVFQQDDPNGVYRLTVDDPSQLPPHRTGGVWMQVEVTESDAVAGPAGDETPAGMVTGNADQPTWQIDYLYIDATAIVK